MEEGSSSSSSSTTKRKIDDLEQKIQELEHRIEKLEEKKKPRKSTSTVADVDEKVNTILNILSKIVVPTTAATLQEDFIPLL